MRTKLNRVITLIKALNALVMEFESQATTVENQVETPQVLCPLLPPKPDIRYAGEKIELIRVLLSLCLLGRFEDSKSKRLPACKVFQIFGHLLGEDWGNGKYLNALGRTKQECTSMDTQTKIFKEMEEAIRKYFEEK